MPRDTLTVHDSKLARQRSSLTPPRESGRRLSLDEWSAQRIRRLSVGPLAGLGSRAPLKEGRKLDDFTDRSLVGSGEFAIVYSARDSYDGSRVALKVLKYEHMNSEQAYNDFFAEEQFLSKIASAMEHIVKIRGSGFTEDLRPFIVLELLSAGNLGRRLADERDTKKRVGWALDIATALASLHSGAGTGGRPILHRDLKPDNVGFDAVTGELKLLDFGLVSVGSEEKRSKKKTPRGSMLYDLTGCTGSIRYMAPEVGLGMPYNEKR